MKKCIVIGGGFAGLSAAAYLTENNIRVKLLESSPKLGGRAYSFAVPEHDDIIDNGQHIMMGCYTNTIDFLNLIGAADKIEYQKNLRVNFIERGGRNFLLDAGSLFYPFNLLLAVLKYNAIRFRNRLKILKLFIFIALMRKSSLQHLTVQQWLKKSGQNSGAINALWEIIAIGTLNTGIEKASAAVFIDVLRKIFHTGSKSSVIILPSDGLSKVYCEQAEDFIQRLGSEVCFSESVVDLVSENGRVTKVKTQKSEYNDFDFVVSAAPLFSLHKYAGSLNLSEYGNLDFEYSSIINIHFWLKDNPFGEKFYGLISSKVHWVFNHGKHITLVTSNAGEIIDFSKEKIVEIFCKELEEYFPVFNRDLVIDFKVIKEKRATFVPGIETEKMREKLSNNYANFFIAGDWTNTGLPSTIEGAVKSGIKAAEAVKSALNK